MDHVPMGVLRALARLCTPGPPVVDQWRLGAFSVLHPLGCAFLSKKAWFPLCGPGFFPSSVVTMELH